MRRSLVVSLALLAIVRASAVAQTCVGLPSHSAGQMQVTGNAAFNDLYNSFGAGFGYGMPSGIYGGAQLGTTSYDGVDGSALDVGVNAGYQMSISKRSQAQLCPVASLDFGMGPKDIDAGGTDASSRRGSIGLSVGTFVGSNPRMKIVPHAGLGLAYRKEKLEDATTTVEASETYGQASLGVGLIFNSKIAVRPSVSIPLGSDFSNDPTFGLTVAYNFGSKGAPARRR